MTQTPASGPFELVTVPPMSSEFMETVLAPACAAALLLGLASVRTIAKTTTEPHNKRPNTTDRLIQFVRIEFLLSQLARACTALFSYRGLITKINIGIAAGRASTNLTAIEFARNAGLASR
jgi:hypothetical protein